MTAAIVFECYDRCVVQLALAQNTLQVVSLPWPDHFFSAYWVGAKASGATPIAVYF